MENFNLLSMGEFAAKHGLSRERISQLVKAGRVRPAPVRAGKKPNAPMYFRPTAKIIANGT